MNTAAQYWKAVLAFIVPGVVILGTSITVGSDGGAGITSSEWLMAAFSCILTAGAVAAKGNAPPPVVEPVQPAQPLDEQPEALAGGPVDDFDGPQVP